MLLKYLAKAKPSESRDAVALQVVSTFVSSPRVAVTANLDTVSAVRLRLALSPRRVFTVSTIPFQITSAKDANDLLLQFLKPSVKSFSAFAASSAATLQRAGKWLVTHQCQSPLFDSWPLVHACSGISADAAQGTIRSLALAAALQSAYNSHASLSFAEAAAILDVWQHVIAVICAHRDLMVVHSLDSRSQLSRLAGMLATVWMLDCSKSKLMTLKKRSTQGTT